TKPGSRFTLPNPTMRPSPTHPPHTAVNADRLIARIAMMSPHGLRSGPSSDRGSASPARCAWAAGPASPNPDRTGSPAASTGPDWSTSSRTIPPDRSTRPVALPGPPDRSTTPEEDPGPDRSATPARAVDRTRPPDSVRASNRYTGPVLGTPIVACSSTPDRYTRPGSRPDQTTRLSPSLDPVHRTSIRSAHAGLRHHTGPVHHAIHLGLVCRTPSPPLNPGIRLAPVQRRDQPFYPDQSSLDCLDTDSSILVRTGGLLTPSRPVRPDCPTRPDHRTRLVCSTRLDHRTRRGGRPDRLRPGLLDRSTRLDCLTGPP